MYLTSASQPVSGGEPHVRNTRKKKDCLSAENVHKAIDANPFAKLGDIVYSQIENAILSSSLVPGQKLNITKLAERLDVSTSPVRDAVERLCARGLVVNEQREDAKYSSYYVFDMNNDSIQDLYYARKSVESTAAYLCARKNWQVDLPELKRLAEEFRSSLAGYAKNPSAERDAAVTASLDRKFHNLIVRSTRNPYLIEMYDSMGKYLDYMSVRRSEFLRAERDPDSIMMIGTQHFTIYNAIKLGFSDMARSIMDEHIEYCTKVIIRNRHHELP